MLDNAELQLDFIVIGAQKSGTSFIREVLMAHGEVFFPTEKKEMHYFDRDLSRKEEYFSFFNGVDEGFLKGEKTPAYMHMSERRILQVKRLFPNAKLILILRNPVERAWSQARMEVSNWNTKELANHHIFRLLWNISDIRNKKRSNYADALALWLKYFDRDKIHVSYYDDLQSNAKTFMEDLYRFLGIENRYPNVLLKKVFAGREYQMPRVVGYYLSSINKKNISGLSALGFDVPSNWHLEEVAEPHFFERILMFGIHGLSVFRNILYLVYKYSQEQWHFYKMRRLGL